MKAHLLFEQSGTFKNAFIKNGVQAYDYDILNDFGETDFQIDIFKEIQEAYVGGRSVFDTFSQEDIIFAFFPCTRFEDQVNLSFRGDLFQMKSYTDEQKLETCIKLHNERAMLYEKISQLVVVCLRKRLKCVIENPYSAQHYLKQYWCIKPKIIDMDRRQNGDYYKKPTQYWFINFEPRNNFIFEPLEYVETKTINHVKKRDGISRQVQRSLIHPQYADRFIRERIL